MRKCVLACSAFLVACGAPERTLDVSFTSGEITKIQCKVGSTQGKIDFAKDGLTISVPIGATKSEVEYLDPHSDTALLSCLQLLGIESEPKVLGEEISASKISDAEKNAQIQGEKPEHLIADAYRRWLREIVSEKQ